MKKYGLIIFASLAVGGILLLTQGAGKFSQVPAAPAPTITTTSTAKQASTKKPATITAHTQRPASETEALAAADAFFRKSVKDCGNYQISYGPMGVPVALVPRTPNLKVSVDDTDIDEGTEWVARAYVPTAIYAEVNLSGYFMTSGWKYPQDHYSGEIYRATITKKQNGAVTYNGKSISDVPTISIPCQDLKIPTKW